MINRQRKINVEKMSNEELEVLQAKISNKIISIVNNAVNEANKYLNVYGMEARMHLEIGQLGEFSEPKQNGQS
jgi:hypothetical protein